MFVFKLRRDSSSDWTQNNPILADGEPGYETDTRKLKIGDGQTPWISLQYIYSAVSTSSSGGGTGPSDQDILDHINSLTPHPVYDDGPSLSLLYANAKV